MFDRRAKTAPSHYPRLPFHTIRTFQLLSSLIVASIMAYFTYHLRHESYPEPWTFVYLFAASLASILALSFTIILHCLLGLNPRLNLTINGGLSALWAVSFAVLTWYMSGTLAEKCDTSTWNEDVGVMVCRLYKALWTFTLVGFTSTLAALFLDIYVRRSQISRGVYRLPDLDQKHAQAYRPQASRGPFTDAASHEPEQGGYAGLEAPRESEVWDDSYRPRVSTGPYEEQKDSLMQPERRYGDGPSVATHTPDMGGEGRFDDSEYHGVHGQPHFRD